MIYKLLSTREWQAAEASGRFDGSAVDHVDGYIHLSARDQVVETARRHFAGQSGLTLLTIDPEAVGAELRWEASRGGSLFPHLYAPLPVAAVVEARELPDGVPVADAVAEAISS
ncbi:MAG: DUF952 domain-containing protein [Micromonosporaceae bacterium]